MGMEDKNMKYKIVCEYKARVEFEISVDFGDYNYNIIYGKHINGYFCSVPGWKWGCEMTEPNDVFYNAEKLQECGADPKVAKAIAEAIKTRAEKGEPCSKVAKGIWEMMEEKKNKEQIEVDITPASDQKAAERINRYQELLKVGEK